MRELSIFIDESGDFGPFEKHSPFYILSLVFHDQSDDITGHLEKIHAGLRTRGLPADHAVHAGPLIRRSWVFSKRELDYDQLVSRISRELGTLIRENFAYFTGWDRIVIYYDNGQKRSRLSSTACSTRFSPMSRFARSCRRTTACSRSQTSAAR